MRNPVRRAGYVPAPPEVDKRHFGPCRAQLSDHGAGRPIAPVARASVVGYPPLRNDSISREGLTMKITRITAYRVELPLKEGSYRWSGGKSVDVFDSTIVR